MPAIPLRSLGLLLRVLAMGLLLPGSAPLRAQPAPASANPPSDTLPVTFRFTPSGAARSVAVAGTFNNWDRAKRFLKKQPDGRAWSLTLRLEPGLYEYKFVVDGERWHTDPRAPQQPDGNGNINSVLLVSPDDYAKRPGIRGDGAITESGVRHLPTQNFAMRLDRARMALTLRTRKEDVRQCWLVVPRDSPPPRRAEMQQKDPAAPAPAIRARWIPMQRAGSDALFENWRAVAPIPKSGPLRYAFRLEDGPVARRYDAEYRLVAGATAPRWFALNAKEWLYLETPEWPKDAVFYQIFPDRFANGDAANDPKDARAWGSKPTGVKFMGGDLKGIAQNLDYLRDLGVTALYLNPVFAARSNHAYDTSDFHSVDPRFGTNEDLEEMVRQAHAQDIRVILDGVFNHTGIDFFAFKSLRQEGEKSPYRDWYFVKGFPVEVKEGQRNYAGWNGNNWMPELNVGNPETRAYLLDVGTRWIRQADIDGWRLDVANEVDQEFWKAFRDAVRKVKPNAYIVGEMWQDARRWLQGDQWDSVMNYRWRGAVLDFFAGDRTSPMQFDAALSKIRNDYPPAALWVMFNMLGSHDTERLRTVCKGNRGKERQAVLLQLTYPGTPCIYYGDEIGLEGGPDPDNRRAMVWDKEKWDKETRAFYRRLIAIRRKHEVLRRGAYETVYADDGTGVFGYVRRQGKARVLVLFNRGDAPQQATLPLDKVGGEPLFDWLESGLHFEIKDGKLIVDLPPRGMALLGK